MAQNQHRVSVRLGPLQAIGRGWIGIAAVVLIIAMVLLAPALGLG